MRLLKALCITCLLVNPFMAESEEQTEVEKLIAVQKIQIIDRPLKMVGMGLTQKMSDDYYIGTLYIDEAATYGGAEDLVYIDAPRRMEFRFVSEQQVSGRSFGRNFAESIRINNLAEEIDNDKENLAKIIQLFKGSYKKGDFIRIDYHNSFGTRVSLNGKELASIKVSKALYRLLMKTWLGERPPSSTFKIGISGQNETDYSIALLKRYVALN